MTGRRTQLLFLTALLGVLSIVGIAVADLLGPVAAAVYAVAVLGLVLVGAGRARAAEAARRREAGRTCSCCTTTHFDPVTVV